MRKKVVITSIFVILGGLCIARWGWACGPNFRGIRYEDPHILAVSREDVASGHYGVLRPGLPWRDLVRVYRSIEGLPPIKITHTDYRSPNAPDALKVWQGERSKLMGNTPGPTVVPTYETTEYITINNIGDDALLKAASTLGELARKYGQSPAVLEWVQAQDLVFSSTPVNPRIPDRVQYKQGHAPAPEWLLQERAYQIASAHLYSAKSDLAEQGFRAIAADPKHSKRAWGLYLAARCLVRKAELPVEDLLDQETRLRENQARIKAGLPIYVRQPQKVDPSVKLACYKSAQGLLEETLRDNTRKDAHRAAREYLELVRYRTEPIALMAEFLEDQGKADSSLGEQGERKIADGLHFLPANSRDRAANMEPPGNSNLAFWLGAMAGDLPWNVDGELALSRWREQRSNLWLLAALSTAQQAGPDLEPVIAAAKKVPTTSPLSPTMQWHLLRLELSELKGDSLVLRLEQALHNENLPPWAVNMLRSKRQALATDTAIWLSFSSRKPSATVDYEVEIPDKETPSETFDEATALALGEQVPLQILVPLLQEARLPSISVEELAKTGWTKAVLLDDWDHARALVGFLSNDLRSGAAKALDGTQTEVLRFQATLFIMAWPGLRPSVESGLGRQYIFPKDGLSPISVFDSLRDNWWCGMDPDQQPRQPRRKLEPIQVTVPGLSDSDQAAAKREKALLERVASAQAWFGHSVLTFAKFHPEDERIPYALHRVVWTNRSPKCPEAEARALGKEAFQMLHNRYSSSPWAKKTPYYF